MNFEDILKDSIQDFILKNTNEDTALLAMKMKSYDTELKLAILDQIKSRQKAKHKLPSWLSTAGILYPPPDLLEQCSSEATARFKANLLKKGNTFVDLTAGTGSDSMHISEKFCSGVCVEKDNTAARLLEHNLKCFNINSLTVCNMSAETFLNKSEDTFDLIYLDPQRRNNREQRIINLDKCSPNIVLLLPKLLKRARHILLKASPVLDITKTCKQLECIKEVHIVEFKNECKETLYLLEKSYCGEYRIFANIINELGEPLVQMNFSPNQEKALHVNISEPKRYIYEPSPSIMKAGAFNSLGEQLKLFKLHKNTHLYTSNNYLEGFPGKIFEYIEPLPVDRKNLKQRFPDLTADISVRNFPEAPETLYKKLGLKQGDKRKLFACTIKDDRYVLLHVKPLFKTPKSL